MNMLMRVFSKLTKRLSPPVDLKPGDVIGFSGRNPLSDGINIATFGLPRWGISHVGIVGYDAHTPRTLKLFESTSKAGVGADQLRKVLRNYDGRIWAYCLSHPLFQHEISRLSDRIINLEGRLYDSRGALQSGGLAWSWLQAVCRGEDLTSLFCSELVAEVLSYIGIFPTSNASRWSPNHLVRTLRRLGIVNPPERLK